MELPDLQYLYNDIKELTGYFWPIQFSVPEEFTYADLEKALYSLELEYTKASAEEGNCITVNNVNVYFSGLKSYWLDHICQWQVIDNQIVDDTPDEKLEELWQEVISNLYEFKKLCITHIRDISVKLPNLYVLKCERENILTGEINEKNIYQHCIEEIQDNLCERLTRSERRKLNGALDEAQMQYYYLERCINISKQLILTYKCYIKTLHLTVRMYNLIIKVYNDVIYHWCYSKENPEEYYKDCGLDVVPYDVNPRPMISWEVANREYQKCMSLKS